MFRYAPGVVSQNADDSDLSIGEMIENIVPYLTDWVFECTDGRPVPPEDFVRRASRIAARAMIEQYRHDEKMCAAMLEGACSLVDSPPAGPNS
jgi:hypothetical protein